MPSKKNVLSSVLIRSGIIILLLVSLILIAIPVRGYAAFLLPILITLLAVGIVLMFFAYDKYLTNRPGNLFTESNSEYRLTILWYLFYCCYLEILTYIQQVVYPYVILPFIAAPDLFLLLSVSPFFIILFYNWIASNLCMIRRIDPESDDGWIAGIMIFCRRNRKLVWIAFGVNVPLVFLLLWYAGRAFTGSITWEQAGQLGDLVFLALCLINSGIAFVYCTLKTLTDA